MTLPPPAPAETTQATVAPAPAEASDRPGGQPGLASAKEVGRLTDAIRLARDPG